jgi:hypothetical protein
LAIDWVVIEPGDDLLRVAAPPLTPVDWRARPLDVILGGPVSAYAALARQGRLVAPDEGGPPAWRVAGRAPIGWACNRRAARDDEGPSGRTGPLGPAALPGGFAIDDPRRSPLTLAWAGGVLRAATWPEGYAALVEVAASARVPWQPGAARAAVERGEAGCTPASAFPEDAELRWAPGPKAAEWVEGVAIVQGGDNPTLADLFIEYLAAQGGATVPPPEEAPPPESDALLADLLGATLVDAQNELEPAWRAFDGAGRPRRYARLLTEAPPWPPASVGKLLRTPAAGPLLDTLLDQITPDAENRAWLRRSWVADERPIDGALLAEIAAALDGRLAREPRFRAWLRGEWTAWARQRYRRVERQVAADLARSAPPAGAPL